MDCRYWGLACKQLGPLCVAVGKQYIIVGVYPPRSHEQDGKLLRGTSTGPKSSTRPCAFQVSPSPNISKLGTKPTILGPLEDILDPHCFRLMVTVHICSQSSDCQWGQKVLRADEPASVDEIVENGQFIPKNHSFIFLRLSSLEFLLQFYSIDLW